MISRVWTAGCLFLRIGASCCGGVAGVAQANRQFCSGRIVFAGRSLSAKILQRQMQVLVKLLQFLLNRSQAAHDDKWSHEIDNQNTTCDEDKEFFHRIAFEAGVFGMPANGLTVGLLAVLPKSSCGIHEYQRLSRRIKPTHDRLMSIVSRSILLGVCRPRGVLGHARSPARCSDVVRIA